MGDWDRRSSPFDWLIRDEAEQGVEVDERLAMARVAESLIGKSEYPQQGRYDVVERLGRGAFGTVLLARDPELRRDVAIKVVSLPRSGADASHRKVLREARSLASLSHESVVSVYDIGLVQGDRPHVYIVMEYLAGGALPDWLADAPRSHKDILALFDRVAAGLSAIHGAGLVHRDVKPDNIVLDDKGVPKLVDLGLATRTEPRPSSELDDTEPMEVVESLDLADAPQGTNVEVTQAGKVVGTPRYMAPEQHEGAAATAASDQFSLAACVFEALGEVVAYGGETSEELLQRKAVGRRTTPRRPIPRRVGAVLARAMAPEPRRRYPSVEAFRTALADAVIPSRRSPRRLAVAGMLAIAPLAAVISSVDGTSDPMPCLDAALFDADGLRIDESRDAERDLAAWADLAESLDTYAEDWTRARDQVCEHEPAFDPFVQQRRVACLERAASHAHVWRTSVDPAAFGGAGKAAEHIDRLPRPQACIGLDDDLGGLDIVSRAEVTAREKRLHELEAHIHVDVQPQHVADAKQLIDEARQAGHLPTLALALDVTGRLLLDLGHYADADALLTEAVWTAMSAERPTRAAMTLNPLLYARQHSVGPTAVAQLEPLVDRVLEEADAPASLRARLDHVFAQNLMAEDRFVAAEERFVAVQATLELAGGEDSTVYGQTYTGLSVIAQQRGDLDQALELARKGIEVLSRADGPNARTTAFAYDRIGVVHHRRGELDLARANYARSIEILEGIYGPDHPDVAWPRSILAMLWLADGRVDDAAAAADHALEIAEAAWGGQTEMIAVMVYNRSFIAEKQNDLDAAVEFAQRGRDLQARLTGTDGLDVAKADRRLGRLLLDQEHFKAAEDHLIACAAGFERNGETVDQAECVFLRAKALHGQGRRALARGQARRALALLPADEARGRKDVLAFLED